MDMKSCPVPHAQVAARVVDGAAVIVLADAGEVNVLNPVGTRVWELLDGTRSVEQIAGVIAREYAVSADDASRDVLAFVEELRAAQALTLSERPATSAPTSV
jgi:hypothetical protein